MTEVIGKRLATEEADVMLNYLEDECGHKIDSEVRSHMKHHIIGLLANLYCRNDGKLGHKGIEKTLAHNKSQQPIKKEKHDAN